MAGSPTNHDKESNSNQIHTETKTEVSHDGEGTVYAILTVEQGKRRVDWKVGHINGTFAEGIDNYYDGELFYSGDFQTIPENAPSGKYKDETFYELLGGDTSIEDGKLTVKEVYDAEGVDATEWAVDYLEGTMDPDTIIDEWWREDLLSTSEEDE